MCDGVKGSINLYKLSMGLLFAEPLEILTSVLHWHAQQDITDNHRYIFTSNEQKINK